MARRRAALSQRELAEVAQVNYVTICRIERGHTQPHGGTIRRLASALGVPVTALMHPLGAPRAARR